MNKEDLEKQIREIISYHVGGTYESKQKCAEEILLLLLAIPNLPTTFKKESSTITHFGTIISVKYPNRIKRDDIKYLIGKQVLIDNIPYTVKGIESFAKTFINENEIIGILVDQPQ